MTSPRAGTVGIAVVLVALSACASGTGPGDGSATTIEPRPARYEACPTSGIQPPSDMVLVDRQLPNLGDGTLGRVEIYEREGARLEVSVGTDVLDDYEDLDFERTDTEIGDAPATISAAGAFGTSDRLVVLTWDDASLTAPCGELALVGTNLPPGQLVDLARARGTPAPARSG